MNRMMSHSNVQRPLFNQRSWQKGMAGRLTGICALLYLTYGPAASHGAANRPQSERSTSFQLASNVKSKPIGEFFDQKAGGINLSVNDAVAGSLIVALCGLLWRFRKRHRMELQMAEARTLREANARLEECVKARTRELEVANERARHAARVAGMAEVANSVLHDVGNVLNSLATSSHVLGERLENPILNDLPALAELLGEHETRLEGFLTNDPRGREIIPFLRQLADQWQTEQRFLAEEAASVEKMVRHVQEIIGSQQSLAGVSGVVAPTSIETLLSDALEMQASRIKDSGVIIERGGDAIGEVLVDRVKTVQILVNLIRNAIDALENSEPDRRRIRLLTEPGPRNGVFSIHVEDEGSGIAPRDFVHIFQYGYTTKVGGHGFGLHASALAAQEMGGWLSAKSDGPGCGARLTLELPRIKPSTQT
jgi:two-component system, NtrC family, sensor kinase